MLDCGWRVQASFEFRLNLGKVVLFSISCWVEPAPVTYRPLVRRSLLLLSYENPSHAGSAVPSTNSGSNYSHHALSGPTVWATSTTASSSSIDSTPGLQRNLTKNCHAVMPSKKLSAHAINMLLGHGTPDVPTHLSPASVTTQLPSHPTTSSPT